MAIQKIMPKSEKSLKKTAQVTDFNDIYLIQAIQDLFDTLKEKQRELDCEFPKAGGGVGLASNQIEYPYLPMSADDESPKKGYYPKDFMPPNIYIVSIRQTRAFLENCEIVEPSVYINAIFEPLLDNYDKDAKQEFYEEGCLSVTGFKGFKIPRYENINVQACNEKGEEIFFSVKGFIARVHQHEIDHGLGREYLNQLNFSRLELNNILTWLDKFRNDKFQAESEWIIQDKLKCTSLEPDITALETWTRNELLRKVVVKKIAQ